MKKSRNADGYEDLLDGNFSPFATSTIRLPPELLKPVVQELNLLPKAAKPTGRVPAVRILAGSGDYLVIRRRDVRTARFSLFDSFASHVFLLKLMGLVKGGKNG